MARGLVLWWHRRLVRFALPCVTAAAATFSGLSAKANLIVNGSFESGAFAANKDPGVMQLLHGSTAITGWTVLGGGGGATGDIAWLSESNPWLFDAAEGERFLDLTGYANDSTVPHGGIALAQTVSTTPGTRYRLTFEVGSSQYYNDGVDPQVTVSLNGTPASFTFTGNYDLPDDAGARNHWETASLEFTASGTEALLAFLATTPARDRVIHFDNVTLSAIPEAPTVIAAALLLMPFAASTLTWLRKGRLASQWLAIPADTTVRPEVSSSPTTPH